MRQTRTGRFRLAVAGLFCVCLAAVLSLAQAADPAPGIWPRVNDSHWVWVVPRSDLAPPEIDAMLKRMVDEGTAYVDPKFSATVFFARKVRLTGGKAGKRKQYKAQPGKADDLRIEAEWQNGYLNQNRGFSYTYIPLDAVRSVDLHFLQRPREQFPKAPPGRNWNVNVLADSLYSFFFSLEDSARTFINALSSILAQRGLSLSFSRFGLMWENLTAAQAADMMRRADEGVLITMVAAAGPGDHAGILPLDVVLEANGEKVKNFSHFSLLLNAIPAGAKAPLLLLRRLKDPDTHPGPSAWDTLTVELESR